MKLGLLSDIHEDIPRLRSALARLRSEGVDQIVLLGDVLETNEQLEEACHLLDEAGAVGVWGNHDYLLCRSLNKGGPGNHPPAVASFMSSLAPTLEVEGHYFAHVEPWLDPDNIFDLWFFEGMPNSEDRLNRIFGTQDQRLMFAGHYHQWLLVSPDGPTEWLGNKPVRLSPPQRYFAVIGAVCEGQFATYDTVTHELVPFNEA